MKGEDALAWDDGKGSKWRAFSFLSSGTGYQFTSVSDWTQKTEVDEQRSQSASVGTWAPACTHSRTESSPFAFTSSPQSPLLFEKQSYLSPGFQFTKQINLSPSDAQELVLGTCMARPGCAEVLEHGEFLQNDPTDPLLCKRHWKSGYNGSLQTYLSCSPLWEVLRPSWLEAKRWKCRFLTPLSD